MNKKIILALFFLPYFICSSEVYFNNIIIPSEIVKKEIYPLLNKSDQRSLQYTCTTLAMDLKNAMPKKLHEKIFLEKLHRRCIFLISVYEKDYHSVQWILNNDITYQNEPKQDPFFYYSLCISDHNTEHLTPFMIAEHNKDKQMINILQSSLVPPQSLYTPPASISKLPFLMEICSKNIPPATQNKTIDILYSDNFNFKELFDTYLLLLAAFLNENNQLLSYIQTQAEQRNSEKNLAKNLSHFFYHVIGFNNGKATLITYEDIEKLIKQPLFLNNKDYLLTRLSGFIGYLDRVCDASNGNSEEWQHLFKVKKMLSNNNAKILPWKTSLVKNNKIWNFFTVYLTKENIFLFFICAGSFLLYQYKTIR
jgi:hypothetical protein